MTGSLGVAGLGLSAEHQELSVETAERLGPALGRLLRQKTSKCSGARLSA